MRQSMVLIALLLLWTKPAYSIPPIDLKGEESSSAFASESKNLLKKADEFYFEHQYSKAIETYGLVLENEDIIQAPILKKIALSHAALNDLESCLNYVEKCLQSDFDTSLFADSGFDTVRDEASFSAVVDKYSPEFNVWSFLYLYVALIGFYIAVIINFNKSIDSVASTLIGSFIFIHSFFILHICLNLANYQYQFPHSYLMSTSFSFLYGPLLYFYFKRITQRYKFKRKDLLHLLPTALFLIYILPIYSMSAEEKLALMLERASNGYNAADSNHIIAIVTLKLISLIVYGYFIRKIYLKSKNDSGLSAENRSWQKNIYRIHFLYIASYAFYGVLISNNLSSGFFYHSQVVFMALMVLYVGYSANVQPSVFSGRYSVNNKLFFKYEKSGLTHSLSTELMQSLINLFSIEKIYKENDICLEMVAQRLNTTRHNASQVINEHFDMNFHELVNKYRIQEAKSMLDTDLQKNLNIIDIAYEVGYNNKVTFNKAFKKDTKLTPSEYQKIAFGLR